MSRGLLAFCLVLVIESSGNTVKGDQCSSDETLDAFVGNCQRLVINSSDVERWFTMKFHLRYYRYRFYPDCSLCSRWCHYLASCRSQTWSWWNHCRLKFKYSEHFYITTVPRGEDLPLLEIDVNLCKTIYYRRSRNNDKIFTINITEHKNGMGSIKNVTLPGGDDGFEEEDDLLTKMMKSIQKGDSLQVAVQLFDDQIQQFSNESFRTSRNMTQQEKMREVFVASTALEQFMLDFGQYHLNHTTPQIQFNSPHLDLQLRRNFYQNESEFLLQETKGQNFVRIPAENFHNGSVVLGVMYKNLHEIFLTNDSDTQNENRTRHLNTIIMSATITPRPETLRENVTLAFRNLEDANLNRKCMFLNMLENSPVSWSEQGCRVMSMDNSQTECSCNHMTHFAVLMQFRTESGSEDDTLSETDKKTLEILTYLGLTLSSIGIILTILGYVFLTDMKGPLSQIRVSLVTSLGAGQTIFLAGIGATENKGTCVAVAALVQYFLMAAFCWMLVEGFYLYLFVVKVYNVSNKLKICHGMSWGVPALIVALSLSIAAGRDGVESFVSDEYCWMSSASNLIWIFIVFVVLIELLNILILARVVKEMSRMQQTKDSKTEQIRLGIRACLLLVPLLGFTWLFGLLSPFHKAFAYIFTIFNTTQGFLIFLLHCVRNTEIRVRFKRKIHMIFPAIKDDSGINNSTSANASLKKIEVKPPNRNNKLEQVKNELDENTGGKIEIKPSHIQRNSKLEDSANANASLKKTEVKPSDKNSRLKDSTGDIALLKKKEVELSSRNSTLNGSINANASLKKTEVKPSSKNSKLNNSTSRNASLKNTGVKPPNMINGSNYSTRANALLKKTEVHPSINNSRSHGGGRSRKT